MSAWDLTCGDVETVLREQRETSFDACVCDPPYGLSFMNNHWDYDVPSVESWRAVFRVLKPGAPLLAFAGTRTQHRMAVNIENAGFDIEDTVIWLYGQGKPSTKYRLKPAHEPIILARKPYAGTIELNLRTWGTGALAIEACRVPVRGRRRLLVCKGEQGRGVLGGKMHGSVEGGATEKGRWPANVLLDEEAAAMLDAQSGTLHTHGGNVRKDHASMGYGGGIGSSRVVLNDKGGASRFFYCAKVKGGAEAKDNPHPTKKPRRLTTYLARLVLPEKPGAIVVPYAGSGSEMIGALDAGWPRVFGIEREAAYVAIAERRLADATAA